MQADLVMPQGARIPLGDVFNTTLLAASSPSMLLHFANESNRELDYSVSGTNPSFISVLNHIAAKLRAIGNARESGEPSLAQCGNNLPQTKTAPLRSAESTLDKHALMRGERPLNHQPRPPSEFHRSCEIGLACGCCYRFQPRLILEKSLQLQVLANSEHG